MNSPELVSELLIMPDGKIYVHNLTPVMAKILSELNPDDAAFRQRVVTHVDARTKKLLPESWHEPH